jgi:hypothetical protein
MHAHATWLPAQPLPFLDLAVHILLCSFLEPSPSYPSAFVLLLLLLLLLLLPLCCLDPSHLKIPALLIHTFPFLLEVLSLTSSVRFSWLSLARLVYSSRLLQQASVAPSGREALQS